MRWLSPILISCVILGTVSAVEPLRTIREVRNLDASVAATSLPVAVQGVVTFADPNDPHGGFIQDETAGIFLWLDPGIRLQQGSRVYVEGITNPGDFAPVIRASSVSVLGDGELPKPLAARYVDLVGGSADSQWVELQGVIRSVQPHSSGHTQVDIMAEGHRVRSLILPGELVDADSLIDAEVKVRGVCITHFHQRRWIGVWMRLTSSQQITVEKPPPGRAFEQDVRLASTLLRFDPAGQWSHRVRVRGVVTCVRTDGTIFLQDESGPVQIAAQESREVAPGDDLDAVGFIRGSELHPVLEDAEVRRFGRLSLPEPNTPEISEILAGGESGQLVRVNGRLVDQIEEANGRVLVLQRDGRVFQAQMPASLVPALGWEPGSYLGVTGVCVVPLDNTRHSTYGFQASTFHLLLRSPSDVVVFTAPSWWNVSRVGVLLLVVVGVLLGAVCWAAALHSRVRRQTALIEEKVKRHAVLEERTRIARDLHDTLTQSLAGVAFQLEGIRGQFTGAPAVVREQFGVAVNMLRHSLAEARRSVMNLRALGLERADLLEALEETTRPLVAAGSVRLEFLRQGTAFPLAPRVEHHLLRLGQEAIANALQHSRAQSVRVMLLQTEHETVLEVADNGCGFTAQTPSAPGHFGLVGMRERAAQISAVLDIQAEASKGTVIRITVPAASESAAPEAHV